MPELPLCLKKSNRGNPILVDKDRFEYRMAGQYKNVVHWRCTNKKCTARVHTLTKDNMIVRKRNLHTCCPFFPLWKFECWREILLRGFRTHQWLSALPVPDTLEPELPLCIRPSRRGNPILVDQDRFEYRMDRGNKITGVRNWRCAIGPNCRGRVSTQGEDYYIIRKIGVHSCQSILSARVYSNRTDRRKWIESDYDCKMYAYIFKVTFKPI